VTLEQYLIKHIGEDIPQIEVLSANKQVTGIVKSVVWNRFPNKDFDIERSWVTIEWENGDESWNSVDFMDKVTVVLPLVA